MSISAKNTAPADEEFADIEFCPQTATITEEQPTESQPEESRVEEAASTETAEPETEQATPPTPQEVKNNEKKEKSRGFFSIMFDVLLVILLLGILAGGGYYIKLKMNLYSVPSSLDIALQDNARLQRQRDELVEKYYKADENILMRESLTRLDKELAKIKGECDSIEASIEEQKNKILALQHEIRTTDKEYRQIALSLLPGMSIGDAVTSRGQVLRQAYIYRMEGKLITLRSPEGQIRIPTRELIKKNMPDLARYAFGELDLVDMSDFDNAGNAPAAENNAQSKIEVKKAEPVRVIVRTDYEPASGAPTVDTTAGATISAPQPAAHHNIEEWIPTEGELPF